MPARPEGVYADGKGGWYIKVTTGHDPLSGRRTQLTRRGFATAADAAKVRRQLLAKLDAGLLRPTPAGLSVDNLLDLYLDGLDADETLSAKTRYDYRHYAADYVRPLLGSHKVRDVTPEVILAWQRQLSKAGGTKKSKPLAPNTIRLARAPLAGAFKLAVKAGLVAINPVALTPRPVARRSIPRHWSPEQSRSFLCLMEGDPTYPVWAFLLGSGLRIGELVWLRWGNVDLGRRRVQVVDFASTLGYELVVSAGKSRDAVRSIDLDNGLVAVLQAQRERQDADRQACNSYVQSDYVFTQAGGGSYHPQKLSRMLGRYSAELGLPRLTAHGLRHSCATLMLANGVPPKVAAERLGHADASLFTNLYSHVTPTMQREAADLIGASLFGASSTD